MSRHRKVCYLSGKMRGIPDFGFSLFDEGKRILQSKGWRVISPADMDRAQGFSPGAEGYDFDLEAAFRRDFKAVLEVDAVVLLPNWKRSSGAHAELVVAHYAGVPVYLINLEKKTVTRAYTQITPAPRFALTVTRRKLKVAA